MKRIKLFTHGDDLDGVSCGVLAKIVFANCDLDIEYCNYNNVDEKILKYFEESDNLGDVYITDISVKEEIADKINGKTRIRLFDHHQTAMGLNKYPWANVIINYSGTKLFYDYLVNSHKIKLTTTLEMFVSYVNSYDTWEWQKKNLTGPKLLNNIFCVIEREEFIEEYTDIIKKEFDLFPKKYVELVEKYEADKQMYIDEKLDNSYIINFDGYKVAYCECNRMDCLSILGNKMCTNFKCDFSIIFTGKNMSLRSVGDFDVSEIAKKYGGGGHKNAAGCPIIEDVVK